MALFAVANDGLVPICEQKLDSAQTEYVARLLKRYIAEVVQIPLLPVAWEDEYTLLAVDSSGGAVLVHLRQNLSAVELFSLMSKSGRYAHMSRADFLVRFEGGAASYDTAWEEFSRGIPRVRGPRLIIVVVDADDDVYPLLADLSDRVHVVRASMYQDAGGHRLLEVEHLRKNSASLKASEEGRSSSALSAENDLPALGKMAHVTSTGALVGSPSLRVENDVLPQDSSRYSSSLGLDSRPAASWAPSGQARNVAESNARENASLNRTDDLPNGTMPEGASFVREGISLAEENLAGGAAVKDPLLRESKVDFDFSSKKEEVSGQSSHGYVRASRRSRSRLSRRHALSTPGDPGISARSSQADNLSGKQEPDPVREQDFSGDTSTYGAVSSRGEVREESSFGMRETFVSPAQESREDSGNHNSGSGENLLGQSRVRRSEESLLSFLDQDELETPTFASVREASKVRKLRKEQLLWERSAPSRKETENADTFSEKSAARSSDDAVTRAAEREHLSARARLQAIAMRVNAPIALQIELAGRASVTARLTAWGTIQVEGATYYDPNEAAAAVLGDLIDGWSVWKALNGRSLGEL